MRYLFLVRVERVWTLATIEGKPVVTTTPDLLNGSMPLVVVSKHLKDYVSFEDIIQNPAKA